MAELREKIENVSLHEARINAALGQAQGGQRQDLLLCLYGWQE